MPERSEGCRFEGLKELNAGQPFVLVLEIDRTKLFFGTTSSPPFVSQQRELHNTSWFQSNPCGLTSPSKLRSVSSWLPWVLRLLRVRTGPSFDSHWDDWVRVSQGGRIRLESGPLTVSPKRTRSRRPPVPFLTTL